MNKSQLGVFVCYFGFCWLVFKQISNLVWGWRLERGEEREKETATRLWKHYLIRWLNLWTFFFSFCSLFNLFSVFFSFEIFLVLFVKLLFITFRPHKPYLLNKHIKPRASIECATEKREEIACKFYLHSRSFARVRTGGKNCDWNKRREERSLKSGNHFYTNSKSAEEKKESVMNFQLHFLSSVGEWEENNIKKEEEAFIGKGESEKFVLHFDIKVKIYRFR